MHIKLLFWMSVMLLVGDILALNCTWCDESYKAGDCDPTKVAPESVHCVLKNNVDPYCMTLVLGTEVKEKTCVNINFIRDLGGQGNDCFQVNGQVFKTHSAAAVSGGPVRRTLQGDGATGRFQADPNVNYEFCSCEGDDCNSPTTWPYGAPVTTTTSTTKTSGGGGGGGGGSGSGETHPSLGFGKIVIMCVIFAHSMFGF